MYGYIYLTENLIDGRCYIGMHKPHRKDRVDNWYKGSGKVVRQAFEKYGKENFITTVVEWCETEQQLLDRERYWIDKCNANYNPTFYNISPGGNGGAVRGKGWHQSDYQKQRASEANKGKTISVATRKKLSVSNRKAAFGRPSPNKHRHCYTNGLVNKMAFECPEGFWPGRVYYGLAEETA